MQLLKQLRRRVTNLFYGLGFGMRAADEIIATNNVDSNDGGTTIEQQVQQKSVYKDLLQGEVTQEVEALRYSTFKAEEESMNYTYLGNGQAEKHEISDEIKVKNRKHFTQPNLKLEYSQEEIKNLPDKDKTDPPTRYLIHIEYNEFPKFKLENLADSIEIWCDDEKKEYKTKLIFINDSKNRRIRPLVNAINKVSTELENLPQEALKTYSEKCELLKGPSNISFTTFKASNNVPNGIEHQFWDCSNVIVTYDVEKCEAYITYKWFHHSGGQLLSERFYSKLQDERYKNKEKKENFAPLIDMGAKKEESN